MAFNILNKSLGVSGSSNINSEFKDSSNQSPFITTPHGHPGFHPQKVGKCKGSASRNLKPHEESVVSYGRAKFSRNIWDQVKTQNPETKVRETGKVLSQMWKGATKENKTEYVEDYGGNRLEYEKSPKAFHNFSTYLKSGGKAVQPAAFCESDEHLFGGSKQHQRIYVQPAEEGHELSDDYSVKHVACARYLRNHRLMNEVFNDFIVPDVRSIVTTARLQVLSRQVQSLTMHQKKLEAELQQIEGNFETKKRKFAESSEAFQKELKTLSKSMDKDNSNNLESQLEV